MGSVTQKRQKYSSYLRRDSYAHPDLIPEGQGVCERCKQASLLEELTGRGVDLQGNKRYIHRRGFGCGGKARGAHGSRVEYTETAVEYALMPYEGAQITWESDLQRVCLNDIHKALGEPEGKEPDRFMRLDSTKARVEFLMKKYNLQKVEIMGTQRGKGGGSWPVRELGLDYAMWADMRFHDACIDWLLSRGVGPEPSIRPVSPLTADDVIRDPEKYLSVLRAAKIAEDKRQEAEDRKRYAKTEAERLVREAQEEAARLEREAEAQLRAAKAGFNGPPQPYFYLRAPIRTYDGKVDFKQGQTITLEGRNADYANADPRSFYRVVVPCVEQHKCENVGRRFFAGWLVKGTLDHFEGVPLEEYERFAQWLESIDGTLTPDHFSQYCPPGAMF